MPPHHLPAQPERPATRRNFLQTTALSAATLVTAQLALSGKAGQATAEDADEYLVDAHSHIWTTDLARYPLQPGQTLESLQPRSFTPEELDAVAVPLGVKRVVLIQHNIFHGKDNSYIVDTIRRFPQKYSGVACIDAGGKDPVAEMQQLRVKGIRGLRIRPGDGGQPRWRDVPGMKALWKAAPAAGVAMCPLIDANYLEEVDHFCREYRDTTVVIDHFARIGVDGTIRDADVKNLVDLAQYPHVHVKVSAFYALGHKRPPHTELIPMIRALYDSYGPERLMWASDCPYQLTPPNTYADSVDLIRTHIPFLTPADKTWLFRKTAEKVFFA